MTTHPIRHRSTDPHADVEAARLKVDNLRRGVAARKVGASSLAIAEYELHRALDRLDAIGTPPQDAA